MTGESSNAHHLERINQQHKALRELLGDLQRVFVERRESVARVSEMLLLLIEHLEEHFAEEEAEGFFGDIVAQAPRMSMRADGLRHEHVALLEFVGKLKGMAVGDGSGDWWERLDSAFREFSDDLCDHESRENALLQDAYGEDIGSQD